jgi:hypothetical protein
MGIEGYDLFIEQRDGFYQQSTGFLDILSEVNDMANRFHPLNSPKRISRKWCCHHNIG